MSNALDINLGIDFGTSYTKVCYRDVGAEKSGIIAFNGDLFPPSIVHVDERGVLSTPITSERSDLQDIRFLKMRIGGSYNMGSVRKGPQVNLRDAVTVEALSSYYVANVIRGAKIEFERQEFELAAGRTIRWSANVGVPVEHYDSSTLPRFRRVFAIAWKWETSNSIPTTVEEAIEQYWVGQNEVETTSADCHAVPEIIAAVWSFVTSREAQDGIYTYFDVGGGTVDGVCFRYETRSRRIRCYSAKVEPLGVSEISRRLATSVRIAGMVIPLRAGALASIRRERHECALFADKLPPAKLYKRLRYFEDKIHTLVGDVIMTARYRKPAWALDRQRLPIFLGGGGAHSKWYRTAVSNTLFARQLPNVGIRILDLKEVPMPRNLNTNDVNFHFPRFTVAYGLSFPKGEEPGFDPPSVFPVTCTPPR